MTIIIKVDVGINNIELKRKPYLHVQNSLKCKFSVDTEWQLSADENHAIY